MLSLFIQNSKGKSMENGRRKTENGRWKSEDEVRQDNQAS